MTSTTGEPMFFEENMPLLESLMFFISRLVLISDMMFETFVFCSVGGFHEVHRRPASRAV